VCSRPASTIRSAPAASQRPVPVTRCHNPSAGVCLTRHQRGFTCVHPSDLPQPVTPGWNGDPWASTSGFAPRSYPLRRTLRRGRAMHTGPGLHHRHQSNLLGDNHSTQATSRRRCSKQQCVTLQVGTPTPGSRAGSKPRKQVGVGGQPDPIFTPARRPRQGLRGSCRSPDLVIVAVTGHGNQVLGHRHMPRRAIAARWCRLSLTRSCLRGRRRRGQWLGDDRRRRTLGHVH
jgi:hypothetical protein